MIFTDFYNLLKSITTKLYNERNQFSNDLLETTKENIILSYLELYIYSRLKFFFQYIEKEARNDNYLFTIAELEKIKNLDNLLMYIKSKYFNGETYENRLSNVDLIQYFKSI